MDATELLAHKRSLREMIRDAVERRDGQRLEAISTAVHDLELELLESFWELDQLAKGIKHSPKSQLGRRLLAMFEGLTRGYSVALMSAGVTLAWKAARIRSRIKGSPVPLEFEAFRENSSPLG
jgi:hypothetical protein